MHFNYAIIGNDIYVFWHINTELKSPSFIPSCTPSNTPLSPLPSNTSLLCFPLMLPSNTPLQYSPLYSPTILPYYTSFHYSLSIRSPPPPPHPSPIPCHPCRTLQCPFHCYTSAYLLEDLIPSHPCVYILVKLIHQQSWQGKHQRCRGWKRR